MVELKKIVLLYFVFLLFSTTVTVRLVRPVEASLPVHNIDAGLDYATIQEAIAANETIDGHTIFVEQGIYCENLVLNKTVWLIGENRGTTIIDGNSSGPSVLINSSNVIVSGFTIRNSSTSSGVNILFSNNCVISNNIITNNQIGGIGILGSNNLIISNIMANSPVGIGISFTGEGNNIISGNTIASNSIYGISIVYSSNNKIFHNNFIDNGQQTYSSASINTWDDGYPSGGNYWSDYNGTDTNGDGVGDTPYVIYSTTATQKDKYPLIDPYVTPEELRVLYYDLLEKYDTNMTYHELITNYELLNSIYNNLNANYDELKSEQEATMTELNNIRNLVNIFITTTIIFIASTAYLAIRRPKVKTKAKAT